MPPKKLDSGKSWVEQHFRKIAGELKVPVMLAAGARWSEPSTTSLKYVHYMAYEVTVHGRYLRGEMVFRDVDLEDAGSGEKGSQDKLAREIRRLLQSFQSE